MNRKKVSAVSVITILFLMLSCIVQFISPQQVKAEEVVTTYSASYDVKNNSDQGLVSLVSGEAVELVITKDGNSVGNPVWYNTNDLEWKVTFTDSPTGSYKISVYNVSQKGEMADTSNNQALAFETTVNVGVVGLSEVMASFEKYSSTVAIFSSVTGVSSTLPIQKVYVDFLNSKNKLVYSSDASLEEGTYVAKATFKDLKNTVGKYITVVNIVDENNVCYTPDKNASASLNYAVSSIGGRNPKDDLGIFSFKSGKIYTAGSLKVKNVSMTIWQKTSDKKTYTNLKKNSDGTYKVNVNVAKHKYHFGTYNVSVKAKLSNGKSVVVAKGQYRFKPDNFFRFYSSNSKFQKKIVIYNPTETVGTYLRVWSKKSKGEDEVIYPLKKSGSHLEAIVNMKKLKYSGTIYTQYDKKVDNEYCKIIKKTFKASSSEIRKHGWYYEKAKDGVTYKFYYKNGKKIKDLTKTLKIKNIKLYIRVNRTMNTVTVYGYDSKRKKWNVPVIAFTCSVGLPDTPTPTGTFKTDRNHRWKLLMGPSWGQYATHIVGGIYFHSIAGAERTPYNVNPYSYNRLGSAASHGCVRLNVANAKWIYDHAKLGTKVNIYDSSYAGPFGKPKTIKIPYNQNYDPTDPAVKK